MYSYDKDKKEIYYFNFKTKKAQWEHPLDEAYRNLVKKARTESQLSGEFFKNFFHYFTEIIFYVLIKINFFTL